MCVFLYEYKIKEKKRKEKQSTRAKVVALVEKKTHARLKGPIVRIRVYWACVPETGAHTHAPKDPMDLKKLRHRRFCAHTSKLLCIGDP